MSDEILAGSTGSSCVSTRAAWTNLASRNAPDRSRFAPCLSLRSYFTSAARSGAIPAGRAMLVGNHCGASAGRGDGDRVVLPGAEPPACARDGGEVHQPDPVPVGLAARCGQLTGLPSTRNGCRVGSPPSGLSEGARGTAKLWKDRGSLVDFSTASSARATHQEPHRPLRLPAERRSRTSQTVQIGKADWRSYLPVTPWVVLCLARFPPRSSTAQPLRFEGTGARTTRRAANVVR